MSKRLRAAAALAGLVVACGRAAPGREPLVVFAAASLRDVAADLAAGFERRHAVAVELNFAGSNTLAQQIRAAPTVDVFLSADSHWVSVLEDDGRTVDGTRRPILGNRLVLVARSDSAVATGGPEVVAREPGLRLALADPRAVPAGRYAKAYLERSGHWVGLADRVVPALDARAALALVESDPRILGIVYRTDASSSDRVRVLHDFEPLADLPIAYWAVAIHPGRRPEAARAFVEYLSGPEARRLAAVHGFSAVAP